MDITIIIIVFLFGLAIGSFLNVVVSRMSHLGTILRSRSICPTCRAQLKAADLIPVISFLWLKATCRYCNTGISWQYPLVELATGIIYVLLYLQFGLSYAFFTYVVLTGFLIVIFVYDLRWKLILDSVTMPAMVIALITSFLLGLSLIDILLGGIIGGGFFLVQYVLSKGRWVGGGDIRLGLLVGFILGWPLVLLSLALSYVIGAVVSVILLAMRKASRGTQIPFGPFLVIGAILTILYGYAILDWYLSLL